MTLRCILNGVSNYVDGDLLKSLWVTNHMSGQYVMFVGLIYAVFGKHGMVLHLVSLVLNLIQKIILHLQLHRLSDVVLSFEVDIHRDLDLVIVRHVVHVLNYLVKFIP